MIIEHIKATDLETRQWSGGTTTQLHIYPENADYKKQDFQFRISTATVEAEESCFTKLPDVSRKLMILDGEIKIEHQNQYSKILKKFDQDSFSGDWDTKSYGKATDFNLMTSKNTKGEIEAIVLKKSITFQINPFDYAGIYIYSGKLDLKLDSNQINAEKGDFISVYPVNKKFEIALLLDEKVQLIIAKINF